MTTHDALLPATVLQRKAVVYVRQSTPQQVVGFPAGGPLASMACAVLRFFPGRGRRSSEPGPSVGQHYSMAPTDLRARFDGYSGGISILICPTGGSTGGNFSWPTFLFPIVRMIEAKS